MSKENKDYLNLYIGCECESAFVGKKQRLVGITKTSTVDGQYIDSAVVEFYCNGSYDLRPCRPQSVKLILRPLSDISADEEKEYDYIGRSKEMNYMEATALQTMYLLSLHFDLFGLIDAGLAISKTLNPQ